MTRFENVAHGWIARSVSADTVEWAQAYRDAVGLEAEDAGLESKFDAAMRTEWVGFVGEKGFDVLLREREVPHVWDGRANSRPDFTVAGDRVALKTRRCGPAFRPDYVVEVNGEQMSQHPEDRLLGFAVYELVKPRLVIVGFSSPATWRSRARFVAAGELLDDGRSRATADVWQLHAGELEHRAADWIGARTPRTGDRLSGMADDN